MNDIFGNVYYKQADLLLSVLPYIFKNTDFAMHGGTAINFFIRNMPRISVDIDLIYLKILPRTETLNNISNSLKDISQNISKDMKNVKITFKKAYNEFISKLYIENQNGLIKIEPNLIIRGTVSKIEERDICEKSENLFEKFVIAKTLSFSEIYGSKICAALDRQHPRDLFDIMLLLNNEGLTEDIFNSFLIYLLSTNRPVSEILSPNLQDIKSVFEKEFLGMTDYKVNFSDLLNVRKNLIEKVNNMLTDNNKEFLLSFKSGEPNWKLFFNKEVKNLPAIKWKLYNINNMSKNKHKIALKKLKKVLNKI